MSQKSCSGSAWRAARLLHRRRAMTGFVSRPWPLGKAVFLGLVLLRCAYGETPGVDAAPVLIPQPETGAGMSNGGSGGSNPTPTGGGGSATGGGGSAGNASAGGGGGNAGAAGSTAGAPAEGGAGGADQAGGAGGAESTGGQGGEGSGIVGGDPYLGTAWAVPGTIEAENFDLGGANV